MKTNKKITAFFSIVLFLVLCLMLLAILYRAWSTITSQALVVHKQKTAFCLLTVEPNHIWLDFLNSTCATNYDVYIAVDKIQDYSAIVNNYPSLQFIIITDEECLRHNYKNAHHVLKPVVAIDRAFYYFNRINTTKYDYIWFCEDDVFFNDCRVIQNLDARYPTADLIVPPPLQVSDDNMDWYKMKNIFDAFSAIFPKPWMSSLVCLCRVSQKFMHTLDSFIVEHGQNMLIEASLQTIAYHDNMEMIAPTELANIRYTGEWSVADIMNNNTQNGADLWVYHPVKKIENHVILRAPNIQNITI